MRIFLWIAAGVITTAAAGLVAIFRYSDNVADEFDFFLQTMNKDETGI